MQDEKFEWDDDKARANLSKHKVDFNDAKLVFDDPGLVDGDDDTMDYGGKTDWAALDAMSDEEVEAAALADPDGPPPCDDQSLRHMSKAKRIRFGLRSTRQAFADRYHIPLATLLAWERHELVPDAVAAAFLDAIAADPEGVAKALSKSKAARTAAE